MAFVRHVCTECQTPLEADLVQRDEDGEILWTARYFCEECGFAPTSEGGAGLPSQEIRQKLLLADGRWCLIVDDAEASETAFREQLRAAFGLRPAAAPNFIESIPGVAFHGTFAECEMLERILSREGISARVERD